MNYKGYNIIAKHQEEDNSYYWRIPELPLQDYRTIDGSPIQSLSHAINDAKKNIDTLQRLEEAKLITNNKRSGVLSGRVYNWKEDVSFCRFLLFLVKLN